MPDVALAVEHMSVTLGTRPVLRDVGFEARYGEVSALLGPNGAGKSTLLRAVSGLLPYRGTVRIGGHDARTLDARNRARSMSFVPQQSRLSAALSVEQVVAQGRYAHVPALARLGESDRASVERALSEADLVTLRARPFDELSVGEQRRVLVARALATGARLLLLDEPTAALDIEHALRLFALLRSLAAQGHAVVIVLHQLDDALRFADHAALLRAGEIHAVGAARDVLTKEHVRALYGVTMVPGGGLGFHLPEEAP